MHLSDMELGFGKHGGGVLRVWGKMVKIGQFNGTMELLRCALGVGDFNTALPYLPIQVYGLIKFVDLRLLYYD